MAIDVKICGIQSRDALKAAADAGARYAGFVFCSPSRQSITPDNARALITYAPERLKKVGLFVDANDDELRAVITKVPLDMIQLHGSETPQRVAAIRALTGLPVMMALCLATADDLLPVPAYEAVADYLLFDSRVAGKPSGGTGIAFDWNLLSSRKITRPWMLAGGLNVGNLADAVRISGAHIVDLSSGVETNGEKDAAKIKAFIELARTL